jgi:iron complex outermembrane receptor protein
VHVRVCSSGFRSKVLGLLPLAAALAVCPGVASAQSLDELQGLSIEDLAEVNVSSVSKTDQPLSEAPAAIYVLDRDAIVRSGAVTLAEILRLAPNLQVYQTAPGQYVVTARGMNGNTSAQSYSNKLLVLVDGRPVYTPLFSGVYWDLPDLLPDDIDRIEIISGPGATLWGANAVNGVINVITRASAETQGLHVDVRAGPERQVAGARFGGTAGEDLTYRFGLRWLRQDEALNSAGLPADDGRERLGGSFRLDWTPNDADQVTLQGELFDGRLDRPGTATEDTSGKNLLLRLNRRTSETGGLQAQFFYDRIARDSGPGGNFRVDTYDGEFQHSFQPAAGHELVWGGGARLVDYRINGSPALFFVPPERTLFIANGFVQDSWSISPDVTATAGLKLEHLPYQGTSLLPELRLAWKFSERALLWASMSRAVRSPTPFDVEVQERIPGVVALSGNPGFLTEKLTAFELGGRFQPALAVSFSATLFLHRYDDLRTIEIVAGPEPLSLQWQNGLEGNAYGIDAWADWRPTSWWTLAAGVTWLEQDFRFKPGASGIIGTTQLGTDPSYYGTLRSSMNLGSAVTLDLNFRAVGALPASTVPAYQELGGRLAWRVSPEVTLSLMGSNLLHDRHQEYPGGDLLQRRIMAGLELDL